MGVYVRGVLGAFSGKVGNVVGSHWRSIDYMRALPRKSKKAATPMQIAHRAKFALAVGFLSPIRDLIDAGFNDKGNSKMTAFNKATMELIGKIEGQYPDFTIPYDKVVISKGRLANVMPTIEANADGDMEVTWSTRTFRATSLDDDVVNIVLYNEQEDDFYIFQDVTRDQGSYVIDPEGMGTGEFHVWIYTSSSNGLNHSTTKYCNTINV